jgi:hypothetical protein
MSDAAVLAAAANPFSPSSWLEGAVDWLLDQTAQAIETILQFVINAPGPLIGGQLFGGSLDQPLNYAVGIGRYVLPVFVLLGIITWTVRGEPGRILQLLLIETPFVAIGMLLIPVVVAELTGIADALFVALVEISDLQGPLQDLAGIITSTGPQAPFLVIVAALLMLLGGLVTYAVLLVRSVVIAVSVLLGPMLIATRTWEPARGIAGKWVALTAAVVLVKPVIGFMWAVGVALIEIPPTEGIPEAAQATSQLMAGAAVLLLGGLVPTALFKLVPEVGDRVAGSLHTGLGRVATTGLAVAGTASAVAGGFGGSAAGAAAGGGGAGQAAGGGATGGPAGGPGGFGGGPSIPVGAYGREAGGGGGAPPTGPAGGPVGGSGPSGGGPSGGSPSGAGSAQSRPAGQGPAGAGPAGNGSGPGQQQAPQHPASTPTGASRSAGGSSSAPPPPTNPTSSRQRPDPSRPVLPGRQLPPPAMPSSSEDER